MLDRLKKLLPSREALLHNRWLRGLKPWIHHPRLWHMSRKGIALGLALGIFFGLLIPVAQIPFSATMAVVLRANLPVAVASTLVTNPVTFGPVYYGAYKLGRLILLEEEPTDAELESLVSQQVEDQAMAEQLGWLDRLRFAWNRLGQVGKPLIVGLSIVATLAGLVAYALVHWIWLLRVRWLRWQRIRKMRDPL